MDKPNRMTVFPLAALALALATPALTQEGRDWTGPRVGAELLSGARGSLTYTTSTPTTYRFSETGLAPVLFAGYDWQFRPRWVGGVELGIGWPNLDFAPLPQFGPIAEVKSQISLTGRVGYMVGDNTLAYGRLGFARSSIDLAEGFTGTAGKSLNAVLAGAGIESFINDRTSARVEMRYLHGLDRLKTADLVSFKLDELQVAAGVSYHWQQRREGEALPPSEAVWTGFYGGLTAAYAPGAMDNRVMDDLYGPYSAGRAAAGLHLGYDWRVNDDWVIGAQYEFMRLDQKFRDPGADTISTSGPTIFATLKSSQAITLRVGRLIQPETLVYGSLGPTQMKVAASPDFYPLDGGGNQTLGGWQFGLGMETAFSRHLSMRVEGVYTDSRDELVTTNAQNEQVRLQPSVLSGRIGFSYRF